MPSEVVTIPWLEPRSSVSTNTFLVSCFMASPVSGGRAHPTGYVIVGRAARRRTMAGSMTMIQGGTQAMPYKLLSYQSDRTARAGVLVGDTVYDAAKLTHAATHTSVLGVLEDWGRASRLLAQGAKHIASGKGRAKGVPLKSARLLAPVLYPGNIYCAGANYTDHMAEMARAQGQPPGPTMKELGEKPWHFVKTSRSSVVGPGARVKLPVYSQMVDWEVDTLMQDSNTSRMIFDTAEQIAMLSSRVTLQPGDLILTGTPAGVGMPRRLFLKAGDRVKLWIERIGELSHTMAG